MHLNAALVTSLRLIIGRWPGELRCPTVLMIKDADGHLTRHQQVSPSEFRTHQPSLSGFRKDEVQVLSASAESLVILERESNGVRLNLVISDEEEH